MQQQIPERKSNFDGLGHIDHLRPVFGSVGYFSHDFCEQLGRNGQGWSLVDQEKSMIALVPGFAFYQALVP